MDLPDVRPGEEMLEFDPSERADVGICFVGVIRTPWARGNCPKNIIQARETGATRGSNWTRHILQGSKELRSGKISY